MKKEGQEVDIVDPDTLDDEAFEKEREKLLSDAETDDIDAASEGDKGDTGQDEEDDESSDEEEKQETKDEETKPFSLEEKKEETPDFLEIVHGGQSRKLSKDETVRLAQMGFDYESKTRAIAPYRRLIEILEADKNLQNLIQRYIQAGGKLPELQPQEPKLKPLNEYEGEDAAERWLKDGVKTLISQGQGTNQDVQNDRNVAFQVMAVMSMNDPDNFDSVFPEMVQRLPTLTPTDQATINAQCAQGDFRGIAKFYNYVKANPLNPNPKPKPQERQDPPGPKADKFRMRPGGGQPPKESSDGTDLPDPWTLSDKDFRKHMAKLKGHV